MTPDQVESCLAVAREALVQFAEMLADGTRTRAEIYRRARVESDALVCLLDEVEGGQKPSVHYLLDRYEALIATLVN